MKVGILTSSRADYSIFLPLLKAMKQDAFFSFELIVFGTHTDQNFGATVHEIEQDGFAIAAQLATAPTGDAPQDIARSMAKTMDVFSEFWSQHHYDLVFCLGDRYEVFAACAASVPFGVKLAHLHGGETTLGAIDNSFRHSISHMSHLHFTCAEPYKNRVIELVEDKNNVYNCGALSFDNLRSTAFLSQEEMKIRYQVDFSRPSLLITFHPETVAFEKNQDYMTELLAALNTIQGYNYVITMPNADTKNQVIRQAWMQFESEHPTTVRLLENMGTVGYLSAMKYCFCMLGNSSSGFAEATFFPKWVINIGERQKGRLTTGNIISCQIERNEIIAALHKIEQTKAIPDAVRIYGDGHAAEKIISILKNFK